MKKMYFAAAIKVLPSVVQFTDPTPPATTGVTSAVTTALSTVSTDAMSMISSVLPYALAVAGAVIVIMLGVKVFKRITGR